MIVSYLKNVGEISEKETKKIKGVILPIGLLSFAISIILNRFLSGYNYIDFIAGFFMGLSIVFNIAGIVTTVKDRNKKCK